MWLLFCVRARVHEHFIAGIETAIGALTFLPLAKVQATAGRSRVCLRYMAGQLFEQIEAPVNGMEWNRYRLVDEQQHQQQPTKPTIAFANN